MELPDLAPADWSILVTDLADGSTLAARDERRPLRTASVGKLFLLVEVARQAAAGSSTWPSRCAGTTTTGSRTPGSGTCSTSGPVGASDLCVLVGAVSDNLATNALVRLVGLTR